MSKNRRNPTRLHIVVAVACSLAVQAAGAQSFAPWTQAPPQSSGGMATPAAAPSMGAGVAGSAVTGFAPWQDHTALREMGGAAAPISDASASVFRPWS